MGGLGFMAYDQPHVALTVYKIDTVGILSCREFSHFSAEYIRRLTADLRPTGP